MKIGDTYEYNRIVTDEITAAALGSGALPVFGTPYLIAMIENAAFCYMNPYLEEGKSSVGTQISVSHVSPTPVGMEVRVTVEVTGISPNGKLVDFNASAFDACGLIGEGTHQRAVVTADRFLTKCQKKLES